MIPEIQLGVHFLVLNFLVNKLPKQRVASFAKELTECLKLKYKGHWYPKTPDRGTAFRCLEVRESVCDPLIYRAARAAGISIEQVRSRLPDALYLWMDPYTVCYRVGEHGAVSVLKRFSAESYDSAAATILSAEEVRLPIGSWEPVSKTSSKHRRLLVQRRQTSPSECSSDSSGDVDRSRSPDLQDLVNVQPFVPRGSPAPGPANQQHQLLPHQHLPVHYNQQFWIPATHPELVAVQ
jgi:hypothetical protein